jgi:hypothetical protein
VAKDYDQVYDGKWQRVGPDGKFTEICCDCSLTHQVEIRVLKNGSIRWRCWRDDKQTKRYRKQFKNTAASIPK